mmetsp:Transcript_35964/g.101033  ORF Transcript_35964/g.101033 Transcript_35964/m.101033 type:complete len:203 (+) Transcript_35964:849-1457(+)
MSPYTLIGARSRRTMGSSYMTSSIWSRSWCTSEALSRKRSSTGSGCHVVGCSRCSTTNEATPEENPDAAVFTRAFAGCIFLASSSSESIDTVCTWCVKSFSRLTKTCCETLTSPPAADVAPVLREDPGRVRGGVAGRAEASCSGASSAEDGGRLPSWGTGVAEDAANERSRSMACRSAVGVDGLLWSKPPYEKSRLPIPQQE